ncbi:MAG: sulfatase [Acidobacteria bacterium]|nr:sulfatase [Acidobacteriota bacterium]
MQHLTTRRSLLKGAAALGTANVFGHMGHAWARDHTRPNIVFLLADDLRHDAVGYLNKGVRTPHLDRLAHDGVRFHNTFVTTSICCASRASILTGTYARRHNIWDFSTKLPPLLARNSYPALLRKAGYRTGFFGKYGVGDYNAQDQGGDGGGPVLEVPPEDRAGYDVIEDIDDYYDPKDVNREHHNSQRIAEKAEKFIQSTPASQPFCLSLSFKAPHANDVDDLIMGEYVAEPDLLALYVREIFTEGPTVNETAFQTLPDFIRTSESRRRWQGRFSTPWLWQDSVRKYYALATGIDRAIGRIVSVLQEKGLVDNTVIIFTSDNGYFLGDYGLSDKWYGYDASIRVPLIIRPLGKPVSQDVFATTLNIDLAPTMLSLAGVPIPSSMQGENLLPLWTKASPPQPWRTDFLYEHYLSGLHNLSAEMDKFIPSSEGVRNDRYTYLRYPAQTRENEQLFDRMSDPNELKNVIHSAPRELIEQLRKRTDELIAQNA